MSQSRRGQHAASKRPSLKAKLVVERDNQTAFDLHQVQLLEAIQTCGSITAAAKQVGISYKTAWDRIDAMNNLAEQALVQRSAGGAHGGGTKLTAYGEEVLSGLLALQAEHADLISRLGENLNRKGGVAQFLHSSQLRTSARNQYRGKVINVKKGGVNSEVTLALSDKLSIVAIITNDSADAMSLAEGSEVIALVKSSWIMLSTDTTITTSARNKLCGQISHISDGEVNSEISIDLGDGKSVCAMITAASRESMQLKEGQELAELFKASSVILMKT